MQITCPSCKKSYAINSEKIPPNITTAKCKSCGHKMPLKSEPPKKLSPATNTCKVTCHYCSRKYSLNPSKIPPDVTTIKCKACGHTISLKQDHTDRTNPDEATNKIACLYCNKTYTIDRGKIPKDVTTTKCKSCGHAISLAPRNLTSLSPKKALKTTGADLNPAKIAKISPPVTSSSVINHSKWSIGPS